MGCDRSSRSCFGADQTAWSARDARRHAPGPEASRGAPRCRRDGGGPCVSRVRRSRAHRWVVHPHASRLGLGHGLVRALAHGRDRGVGLPGTTSAAPGHPDAGPAPSPDHGHPVRVHRAPADRTSSHERAIGACAARHGLSAVHLVAFCRRLARRILGPSRIRYRASVLADRDGLAGLCRREHRSSRSVAPPGPRCRLGVGRARVCRGAGRAAGRGGILWRVGEPRATRTATEWTIWRYPTTSGRTWQWLSRWLSRVQRSYGPHGSG